MTIIFEVEVEWTQGKFVSMEAIAEQILEQIEGQTLYVDDSQYEVTNASWEAAPKPKRKRVRKPKPAPVYVEIGTPEGEPS